MSTERDELAAVIFNNREIWCTDTEHRQMESNQAAAILAAGYRKPRTITSEAELDALPAGTRLYSQETPDSWVLNDLSEHGGVKVHGTGGGYTHIEDFIKYEAPLTVLYIPEVFE